MAAPDGGAGVGPGQRRRASVSALRERWLRKSHEPSDFAASPRDLDVPVRRGSVRDRAKMFQDIQAAVASVGSPATAAGSDRASSDRPKSSSALGSRIRELQGVFQSKGENVERGKSALGCERVPDARSPTLRRHGGLPTPGGAPEPEARPRDEPCGKGEGAADPSPARQAAAGKPGRVLGLAQQLVGGAAASVEESEDCDSDASDESQEGRGWGQEMPLTSETEALVASQAARRKLRGLRD